MRGCRTMHLHRPGFRKPLQAAHYRNHSVRMHGRMHGGLCYQTLKSPDGVHSPRKHKPSSGFYPASAADMMEARFD